MGLINSPPKLDDPLQVAWLAGILEGEGWFGRIKGYPIIEINMTDLDVIERVADLFGAIGISTIQRSKIKPTYKNSYRTRATGERAKMIMRAVCPWLGERRQQAIQDLKE